MGIEDRIREKEVRFFSEEVRDPKYIVMTPEAYAELFDRDFEEHTSYEGLIVCITNNPQVIDFEIV